MTVSRWSIDEDPGNQANETGPTSEVDTKYFIKEVLDTFGWDVIANEVSLEDGVPLIKRNGTVAVFESLDNLVNFQRAQVLAQKLVPGPLNPLKGSDSQLS